MTDENEKAKNSEELQGDSPEANKHGVLTTQDTPKKPDETRTSATDPGTKDK